MDPLSTVQLIYVNRSCNSSCLINHRCEWTFSTDEIFYVNSSHNSSCLINRRCESSFKATQVTYCFRFTENVYNYTEEEAILRKDEILVETYYYKYAYDKMTKLDFLEHFQSDEHSSEVSIHWRMQGDVRINRRGHQPLHLRQKPIIWQESCRTLHEN